MTVICNKRYSTELNLNQKIRKHVTYVLNKKTNQKS